MEAKRAIPNLITIFGLIGTHYAVFIDSLLLALILQPLDVLDGYLARRLNATSVFGARLDHFGDMTIACAIAWHILPPSFALLLIFASIVQTLSSHSESRKISGRSLMIALWTVFHFTGSI